MCNFSVEMSFYSPSILHNSFGFVVFFFLLKYSFKISMFVLFESRSNLKLCS